MGLSIDREKVIRGRGICPEHGSWHGLNCEDNEAYRDCPYRGRETGCVVTCCYLAEEQEAQRDYEASVEMAEYCERYEQTYNPEDGRM